MANKLIWGADLYKGFKIPTDTNLPMINDILPFQMLEEEEKSIDWIKAIGDYYETAGWSNVEKKAGKIQRNYWLRNAQLNPSDYIINPTYNEYYEALNVIPNVDVESPLEQFYPLIPNIIDVLRGEFLKRDNQWTVEVIDQYSKNLAIQEKENAFSEVIEKFALQQKEMEFAKSGLVPDEQHPEIMQQYEQAMQQAQQELTNVELKFKNFRTTGAKWAQKVINIQEKRYKLYEIQPDAFESSLISDRVFWHMDMGESDFNVELLNPKYCDYHKGPNTKYVSEGDYFLWFDFMSAGDIVNKFGRRMKEDDILKLKEIYIKTANLMMPDYQKNLYGSSEYYQAGKSWEEATSLDPKMNDAMLGKELAYNYMRSPNFDHNQDTDILNPIWGRRVTGHPQMFRVMRLYWRSFKRIGWLTKIGRDGEIEFADWVDEHFKPSIEPKYDKSIIQEESKDNLIYGEHVDWTWVYEWRHLIKISPNQKHTFWLNNNNYQAIYIDGGPIKYQFKERGNPYGALPPVEGCEFSYINTKPFSLVDRLKPLQIVYNICMNKIPQKILEDYGLKVAMHRGSAASNPASLQTDGPDVMNTYEDKLRDSSILDYSLTPEMMRTMGQPPVPSVLNLSTVEQAQLYLNLAGAIKAEAGEVVGITRQRLGQQKASETAYGVQQGIIYSETQTEKYFEQFYNAEERFRQRMVDAAQYYTTLVPESRDIYMNENDENEFLEITNMENLLPQYNIYLKSRANTRNAMQKIEGFLLQENTLDFKPSEKIELLVSKSIPEIMESIKTAEARTEQKEQEQRDHEQALEKQRQDAAKEMQDAALQAQTLRDDKMIQKDLDVATIRALGGMQTDNNTNSIPDAQENLNYLIKNQELLHKQQQMNNQNELSKQESIDKMTTSREKNLIDLKKEKIKSDTAKYVADKNKNKYDK